MYIYIGVLCVGLNRKAAAVACSAFEYRQTTKEYIAVVQGHIDLNVWTHLNNHQHINNIDYNTSISSIISDNNHVNNEEIIQSNDINSDENLQKYVKYNHNNKASPITNTNNSSSISMNNLSSKSANNVLKNNNKWQDEIKEQNLFICYNALHQYLKEHPHILNDIDITNNTTSSTSSSNNNSNQHQQDDTNSINIKHLSEYSYEKYQKSPKLRKLLRKLLKSLGIKRYEISLYILVHLLL